MKFLVDAQLPRRHCHQLRECGHDAAHPLDLPSGNRASDAAIMRIAHAEGRVVITKDDDFVQSLLLRNQPRRLLLIATGNIGNAEPGRLIAAALPAMAEAFGTARYLECSHNAMIIHE